MNFSHYNDLPVRMAVDFINTHDVVSGRDTLVSADDLSAFLAAYDRDWRAEGWFSGEPTHADLAAVTEARQKLRQVFETDDEEAAVEVINEVLEECGARPRVSVHGTAPHLHFEPTGGTVAGWLGATLAMALAVVIVEYGFDRLGRCEAPDCDDVYVDTSRNRSRSKCSTSCTTRTNVAAYRERQKRPTG